MEQEPDLKREFEDSITALPQAFLAPPQDITISLLQVLDDASEQPYYPPPPYRQTHLHNLSSADRSNPHLRLRLPPNTHKVPEEPHAVRLPADQRRRQQLPLQAVILWAKDETAGEPSTDDLIFPYMLKGLSPRSLDAGHVHIRVRASRDEDGCERVCGKIAVGCHDFEWHGRDFLACGKLRGVRIPLTRGMFPA